MIPDGWSKTDLLSLSSNGLMNGAFNDPKLVGTGYKLINVVNLYSEPCIKTTELELLNLPSSDYEKFKAEKYDIFFTRSSLKLEGIAHCNIFLDNREDVIFECHIIRARPNKSKIDPRYLHYYCVSPNARKHFMSYAKTTTMTTIDQNGIGSLNVLLPPLLEQGKIAEILGVWDESIDLLEKLIGKTRSRKQGLMQQLLTGKKRFKEFEGSEWTKSKFSEITIYSKGYTYKSEEYSDVETNTYLITLKCIGKGGGFQEVGLKYFDDKINSKFEVFEGDLLFANTDLTRDAEVVGSPILMPHLKGKRAMISMDLTKVTIVGDKIYKPFLYYLMKSSSIRNSFRAMASGSTVLHLDTNGTKKISLKLPSLPEQEKIASVLSAADEEISTLEKQLAAYKQQKLGLMQQLLTGKIRVE